jgi:hypothetical protein
VTAEATEPVKRDIPRDCMILGYQYLAYDALEGSIKQNNTNIKFVYQI